MSNFIHVPDARTNGLILLKTTLGDIKVGLWTKECPKTTRNFLQLCADGYYDGNLFFKVTKGFIALTGDHTNTGEGGKSIYGTPFKDEIHSRLKFKKRGLLATANTEKNENNSRFFFTLGPTEELQGKHTIFGKVVDDTIFNLIKLDDCEVDKNDRPAIEHKIISAQIIENPFPDIKIREQSSFPEAKVEERKQKTSDTSSGSDSSFVTDDEEIEKKAKIKTKRKRKLEANETSSDDESNRDVQSSTQKRQINYEEDLVAETTQKKKFKPHKRDKSSSDSSSSETRSSCSSDSDAANTVRARELQKIRAQIDKVKEELTQNTSQPKKTNETSKVIKPTKERESETLRKLNLFKNKLKSIPDLSKDSKRNRGQSSNKTNLDLHENEEDFDLEDKLESDD